MKFIPSFGEITERAIKAFKRFPVTITWAIVGTLFTLFVIENDPIKINFYLKAILTFILGVSWLIATQFFIEQFTPKKEWIKIITIALLFLFYWHLPNNKDLDVISITRFILYLIAGHLFVLVAPFTLKWQKDAYFNYLQSIGIAIVRSVFFSLILYLGISLALLAIEHLFNVDIKDKRYFQIFIVCLGIVNTWIYLSDFPKNIYNKTAINYTKALEVFVKYILIPLVILYLIILYAYSIKILINWNLPKGWVSYLVTALAFLGFIIQVLIHPIQKTIKSRVINKFYPWFYILLLPLIVLLFVAIFKRISQYGFTEKRYFVLVLAIWILSITLYMLISKVKRIRVFALSLAIIALVVSFGFWSAFSVSKRSQINQFSKVFTKMKAKEFKITKEEDNQFRSIIQYLSNRNAINETTQFIGFNPEETFKEMSGWSLASKLSDTLNIEVIDNKNNKSDNSYYYYSTGNSNTEYDISDYDYFKQVNLHPGANYNFKSNKSRVSDVAQISMKDYGLYLYFKESTLKISKDTITKHLIDLKPFINRLKKEKNNSNLTPEKLSIEAKFNDINIKLIFQRISINNKNDSLPKISNANAYILLKLKENAQ